MITGDIRNQIDRIWDSFWSGGISNPLEVTRSYLLFIRRLDELHTLEENKPTATPPTRTSMKDPRVTIPTPALLDKVVQLLDQVPMEERDTVAHRSSATHKITRSTRPAVPDVTNL